MDFLFNISRILLNNRRFCLYFKLHFLLITAKKTSSHNTICNTLITYLITIYVIYISLLLYCNSLTFSKFDLFHNNITALFIIYILFPWRNHCINPHTSHVDIHILLLHNHLYIHSLLLYPVHNFFAFLSSSMSFFLSV